MRVWRAAPAGPQEERAAGCVHGVIPEAGVRTDRTQKGGTPAGGGVRKCGRGGAMTRSEETPGLSRPCAEPCRDGWPVSASSGSGVVGGRRAAYRAGLGSGDGHPAGPRARKHAPTSGLLPVQCPSCWNAPSRHLAPRLTCAQGSAQPSFLAEPFPGLPGSGAQGAASRCLSASCVLVSVSE